MNEGCELVCGPQLGQVHRGHVPCQGRNTREGFDGLLNIEALRESASDERNEDEQCQ